MFADPELEKLNRNLFPYLTKIQLHPKNRIAMLMLLQGIDIRKIFFVNLKMNM